MKHNGRFPHDGAYKLLFSHPEMVEGLLRDFVPDSFVAELDFATLEQCPVTYVAEDLRERREDSVWRVKWRGTWCYVYLLLEFQSSVDRWMALRILGYTALLYQDLIRSGVVRDEELLPPVFPIVVYNGGRRWNAAQNMAALIHPRAAALGAYQPQQRYFLLDEGSVPATTLAGAHSVTAALLRLEQAESFENIRDIVGELVAALQAPRYDSLRRAFTVWIKRVILARAGLETSLPELNDLQEVHIMLAERVSQWTEEWKQQGLLEGLALGEAKGKKMGREEGREEGKLAGIRDTLLDLAAERFGTVSPQLAEKVGCLRDPAELRQLTVALLRVDSAAAFETLVEQSLS